MSHFYGTVKGSAKTTATRRGSKASGLTTTAASWEGAVKVHLSHDEETGRAVYVVTLTPWLGAGVNRVLASGYVDGNP